MAPRIAVLFLAIGIAGCGASATQRAEEPDTESEPLLAAQIAAARRGASDTIQLEHTPLADRDLADLGALQNLRVLLLDDPRAQFTAAGVGQLATLPELEHLRIRGRGIDDAALAEIAKIKSLRILNIPQATITDEGLAALKSLPRLVQLRFGSPDITDKGMTALAELPGLLRLHVIDVPITDVGLKTLAGMTQLESLYIDGGEFSDAAMDELFRQRPTLHVHLNQEHHDRDPHRHAH